MSYHGDRVKFGDENVGRFQVPMEDAFLVKDVNGVDDLPHDFDH